MNNPLSLPCILWAVWLCASTAFTVTPSATRSAAARFQKGGEPTKVAIVEKAIEDVAAAGVEGGRQVVFVNKARWARLPEPVRDFIYEHEAAHHALGHTSSPAPAPGGFLRPAYAPEQEIEADRRAARAVAARGALARLKQVLAFLYAKANEADSLPPQRREQIAESVAPVFEQPVQAADPDAVAFLKHEMQELDWHEINEPIWDKEVRQRLAQYKIVYRNTSTIPLRCTLVFATGQWLGKGRWRAVDADVHNVELKSNESFVARGNLTWYEPESGQRTFQHFYDEAKQSFVGCTFPPGSPRPPKQTTADYPAALSQLIDESPSGFASMRGALESEESKYRSLLSLPGMEECEVQLDTGSPPEYQCTTPETTDRAAAAAQYQALVKAIKEALPAGWEAGEEMRPNNRLVFEAWPKDKKETGPTISVWTMHFKASSTKPEHYQLIFILRTASLD